METVKGLTKHACNALVQAERWLCKQLREIWMFNKKHHCITYDDNDSLDYLYDWDDDDDLY